MIGDSPGTPVQHLGERKSAHSMSEVAEKRVRETSWWEKVEVWLQPSKAVPNPQAPPPVRQAAP